MKRVDQRGMNPALLALLTLAFLLACIAQPAFAARKDAGAFSAEVPANWTMTKNDETTTFAAPGGSAEFTVILKKYEKPNIKEIIAEWAGQTPVKMLSDVSYIYEDSSGSRSWGMLADDGFFAEIGASAAHDGVVAFLAGLKSAKGEDGLAKIFKAAASSKEAAEWLKFATPAFAKADDESEGTPYTHKTFTATVPAGWSASEKGETVAFASEATNSFVLVRVLALASDDGKAFTAFAKEQAKKLGGKDIEAGDGVVNFGADKGAKGMLTQFGKKCLLLIFSGDDPKIDGLVRSIGLVD